MTKRPRSFSDQIRQAIKDQGITQYRMAKELGITQSATSRFLNGLTGLNMANLDKIAKLAGLRVEFDPSKHWKPKPKK